MPPEPLPPWDRKEFFRERKHDRSETIGGSVSRWRDSAHHGSRDLNRWGSSDIRRNTGQGKQGGWHFFPEDSQHGYASSRPGEKVGEDESFRPFSRGEGRYGRNNNRDNRGPYNQREWRGHAWETNSGFSNTPVRAHDVGNEHKAREDVQSYSSHSNGGGGGFGNGWDYLQPKDQQDKTSGSNGFAPTHKCVGEDATGLNDWKPIKWTRSGSLSSRGSGFSHLSSSKSVGATEPSKPKVESEPKNATPIQSPSGDANACVTSSAAASDETSSRKKPRLGWGEGLAKYEKKKVDGPEVPGCSKDGAGTSASGDMEHCHLSSVDKSPRLMSLSDCGSPATPSSVACSSSPGLEEKSFGNAVNIDNDIHNLCGSPGPESRNHCEEELSFNLENLDSNSVDNFAAILYELLRTNYSNSMDSSYMRATALNKVLILKGIISKNLEMTESEVDLLETELKSLNSIAVDSSPSAPCSLPLVNNVKPCNEQGDAKELLSRPPLQILSSGDAAVEKSPACNGGQEEIVANHKDADVNSPGTVTSKFVEPLSIVKPASSDETHHATADARDVCLTIKEVQDSKHCSGMGKSDVSTPGVGEKTSAVNSSFVLGPGNEMSHDVIFSSNKELAKEAHELFIKLLPRHECKLKIAAIGDESTSQHYATVKKNFAARKRFLKFKERVITLKFKAFQHLWKEDMRLLSIRKQRAKSHKKFELSMRSLHNGYQKHRSSIRSRFFSLAGRISLVPTTEVINFTKKLLEESQAKVYRDTLKMPALVLDKREKIASRFISNNGLVEDPCAVEKARAIMNPWTHAEKEIFMEKFAIIGKDFKKIASFLDHKTTADCIDFYYKNHKSDCFEKKKKLDVNKQDKSCTNSNYLMTLGKRWNCERNSASLDILGAASVIAANADSSIRNRHGSSRRLILGGCGQLKAAWGDDGIAERSSSFDFAVNERETAAADVLAGICGSLSSEAMSSCGESYRDWKCQKSSTFRRPFTPEVMQNGDDETCSDESCGEMDSTDWTDEEKSVFIQAVSSYGRDFSKISHCVRTRSRDQCKVYFSKARKCLGLDLMHPEPGSERMSVGGGGNGSGSGSDNVCALEVGSGACSDKSGSKMDEDLPLKPMKMSHAVSDPTETVTLQTALVGAYLKNEELVDHNSENVRGPVPHESNGSQSWGRPNAASEGDSNVVVGVDDQSEMILVNESESVLVSSDSGRTDMTEVGAESQSTCAEHVKPVPTVDANSATDKMEVDEKRNASPVRQSRSVWDGKSAGIASQFAADVSCSAFRLNGNYQNRPVSLASVSAQRENSVDFQASSGGCRVCTIFRDESREHLTGLPLLTNAESSQVALEGFSSQMPIQKEMNGVDCRNLGAAPSLLTSDRGSTDPFTSRAYYLQKCSTTSKPPCSVAEFPLVSQKIEQAMLERSRAHSRSLSDSENSSRRSGGDVKLFGKILSNSSSGQKANGNHCEKEREERGSLTQHHHHHHNHKLGNKSSTNLRFANLHDPDEAVLKFDPSSYLGLENVQMRSYACWDGTRLQATFPSIPDSAILLTKYPNAFTNFTTPSRKIGHTAGRGNVFPAREIGGNDGLVDFRRGNLGKVQPYTVDMREALAGFKHPGRGVVGVNMVGRGGIVVGGTGRVSDPVAALKLHFAKSAEEGTRGT